MIASVYRALGATGLSNHPLGFGCYRINHGNEQEEAALRSYLNRGGNLIDTSANYTDGLSETLVGHVLKDYPRERMIVVTKGGYIQGQNMALARRRNFPEIVHYQEGLWHCIHPEFLQTQIERSLDRMQLGRIDVYLLHNPEYFLTEKEHHGGATPADHDEFYRRVREAFRFLETQVDAGVISWYGISSYNFVMPSSEPAMTSVSRCLKETRALRSGHHFLVVQLPMNLFESGGAQEKNNEGHAALEFCDRAGIGVLVNRPLNAFYNHRLIRLADFVKPGQQAPGIEALKEILKPLHDLEQRFVPGAPRLDHLEVTSGADGRVIGSIGWRESADQDGDLLGYRVFIGSTSRGWCYDNTELPENLRHFKYDHDGWRPEMYEARFQLPPSDIALLETPDTEIEFPLPTQGPVYVTVMPGIVMSPSSHGMTSTCHSRVVRPPLVFLFSESLRFTSNSGPRSNGSWTFTSTPS